MSLFSTEIYIVTFLFTIILSVFVLLNNRRSVVHQSFSLLGFSISLWILSNVLINLTYDHVLSLQFVRIAIIWVALLPIFFNQFIRNLYFPDDINYKKLSNAFIYGSWVVTLFIILLSQTSLNVKSISFESWGVGYQPGILYMILLFYMLIVFGFPFLFLVKISRNQLNPNRHQARLILLGACITVILSIFTNIIFPFLGYGFASIFGPPTVLIFLLFVAYSITKHRLFNIRVIAIEVVIFILWVTLVFQIFTAKTHEDLAIRIAVLATSVIFGILLIRSTLNEIKQQEQIDKLSNELRKAYADRVEDSAHTNITGPTTSRRPD